MSRLTSLGLLLLPIGLLALIGGIFVAERRDRVGEQAAQRLEATLERTAATAEVEGHLRATVWPLIAQFRQNPRRLRQTAATSLDRFSRAGFVVDLFFFDDAGALTAVMPETAPGQWLMRQLVKGLTLTDVAVAQSLERRLKKALNDAFGPGVGLSLLRSARHRIMRIDRNAGTGWLCWTTAGHHGLVVVVRATPPIGTRFTRALRFWRLHRLPTLVAGIGRPTEQTWTLHHAGADTRDVTASAAAAAFRTAYHRGEERVFSDERLWVFRQGDDGRVFFMALPWPPSTTIASGVFGGGFAFAVAGLVLLFIVTSFGRARSLRKVTLALFVLGGLTPSLLLIGGAIAVLAERYDNLISRLQRTQGDLLKRLDEGYIADRSRLKDDLVGILRRTGPLGNPDEVASATQPLREGDLRAHLELRAPNGVAVYASVDEDHQFGETLDLFFWNLLQKYAPNRYAEGRQSPIRRGNAGGFAGGGGDMTVLPRILHDVGARGERSYFVWDFFTDSRCPTAIGAIYVRADRVIARYLRRVLHQRTAIAGYQLALAAVNTANGRWINVNAPRHRAISLLIAQARFLNRPVSGRIRLSSRDFWYTITPARELAQHCLVALCPVEAITRPTARLGTTLGVAAGMAMVVAAMLGSLVSQRLLAPLGLLAAALIALQQRRFDHVIPLDRPDELGQLAHAFNDMFVGLREFDLARAVQAGLIPRTFPTVPGYDITGTVQFARDLGGDCLDCRVLPGGRVLLLIGDVSGHGVASALFMATVKATVTLWSTGAADPNWAIWCAASTGSSGSPRAIARS